MFFLIQTENELQIIPVSQEKEKEFHEKYHPRILTEGVSIQDALRKFEWLNLFPNYFDDEGFLFYPLQELTNLEEELNIDKNDSARRCLIFAEFIHLYLSNSSILYEYW